jgi:hypothetical protein
MRPFLSGPGTPVLKRSDWALFGISGLSSALKGSGNFAEFSKNARIGKPEILWGFRGLFSQIGVVASEYQDNDQENSYVKQKSCSGETGMNPYVLIRTMKIRFLYDGPRLRASPRHGGQGVFQSFIRRGGVPSGAATFIITDPYTRNNSKIASDNHNFQGNSSLSLTPPGEDTGISHSAGRWRLPNHTPSCFRSS